MVEDTENEWIRIGLKEELKPNTDYYLDTEYIGFLKASGCITSQTILAKNGLNRPSLPNEMNGPFSVTAI